MTGMLISGRMSTGVLMTAMGLRMSISSAITIKVYGRRSARATIHMDQEPFSKSDLEMIGSSVDRTIGSSGRMPDQLDESEAYSLFRMTRWPDDPIYRSVFQLWIISFRVAVLR